MDYKEKMIALLNEMNADKNAGLIPMVIAEAVKECDAIKEQPYLDYYVGNSEVLKRVKDELSVQAFPSLDKVCRQQAYLYVFKDGCWWIVRKCKRNEQPVLALETLKQLTRKNCMTLK